MIKLLVASSENSQTHGHGIDRNAHNAKVDNIGFVKRSDLYKSVRIDVYKPFPLKLSQRIPYGDAAKYLESMETEARSRESSRRAASF